MYGHRTHLEELSGKLPELEIFDTLETKGVTKTGAASLYKASSPKLILTLESKVARKKL